MKRLLLVAFLFTTSVQAASLDVVQDNASQRFDNLWDTFLVDEELAWEALNGVYAQCLHTVNVPANGQAGPPQEERPVVNRAPHDHPGQTCEVIFGPSNIDVNLPFAIEVHVYETPADGWGFEAVIYIDYEGTQWIMAKNYGPETWRAHDWIEVEELP